MKTASPVLFYLRILVIGLFISALSLAHVPKLAMEDMGVAQRDLAAGDPQAAARHLADIASFFPWRYDLNLTAARYAFQAADYAAAIRYFERPGTVSHLSTEDILMLGDAYAQAGNSAMAEAIWKHVIELGDALPATQRLAGLYLKQKDYPDAAAYLRQLLYLDPSDIHLYYQAGKLLAVIDPIQALPFLAQAAALDTPEGNRAKALYDRIRTASLFDEPAYTSLIVGRQLANEGDWQMAMAAFQAAIVQRPGYADAWAFFAEAKQQVSRQETGAVVDTGRPELELALQLDGSSVLVNTLTALYWERQGDYTRAQLYAQKAIALSPQDPNLFVELGNILSKTGDLPAAQSAFESAIQLSPQDPLFYRQLAQFAMDNNIQVRELALPALRQALVIDPTDPETLDLTAQVMLVLLDYQSAERYATSAVQSDPGYAPAYLHLGTACLYQGESEQALHWLSLAQTIDPSSWAASQAARMVEYYFPR